MVFDKFSTIAEYFCFKKKLYINVTRTIDIQPTLF